MDWNLSTFFLCTLFVFTGSLLQAVTGLGAGLLIVPLLATVSLDLIPGAIIFASLSLSSTMAFFGRKSINTTHFSPLMLGLLLGTISAAFMFSWLPVNWLGVIFGSLILIMVLISVMTPKFSLSASSLLGAGSLSGFMGASAGIGAPVLAMVYQNHQGAVIRPTLAFLYFYSSIIMLIALYFVDRFDQADILSGFYLMPGFILGYLFSSKLAGYIDQRSARWAILIISSISAVMLIIDSF